MRRFFAPLTLGGVLLACVPTLAAAQQPVNIGLAGAFAAADLATSDLAPAIAATTTATEEAKPVFVPQPRRFDAREGRGESRAMLNTLSIATAALQGLDAYTTMSALKMGAVEANPMMRGVAGKPAVLIAVKSSMTAATIMAARSLWPRSKVAAVAMLAISNGVLTSVVAHNMSVMKQLR
jgi:hypothetical protein